MDRGAFPASSPRAGVRALRAEGHIFDPARDGFGFKNPFGIFPERQGTGVRGLLFRRFDAFLYGNGLCFGMAAAALDHYAAGRAAAPLAELEPAPEVLDWLMRCHARQLAPQTVTAAVGSWLRSQGGRPDLALRSPRVAGDHDPHILCLGPAFNRRFLRSFRESHAVAPYRIEMQNGERRIYVYDPNRPGSRVRYISLRGRSFEYGDFSSVEGWGISLVPLSAVRPLPELRGPRSAL